MAAHPTARASTWRHLALAMAAAAVQACTAVSSPAVIPSPTALSSAAPGGTSSLPATPTPSPVATPTPTPTVAPGGVYWATVDGTIAPALADIPERVYVPNEGSGSVVVIDPVSLAIVDSFKVGAAPEHITPDWDGQRLYVNNMNGGSLTVIDPRTGRPTGSPLTVPFPYNLYFTPDGARAIVVVDILGTGRLAENGLHFYDRTTWTHLQFVPIPWTGANHLDFSADGHTLLVSCETSGRVAAVDVDAMKVIDSVTVGGSPLDVRLSPDGKVIFVANQGRNGVDTIDAGTLKYLEFIPTGPGAHGLALSRDVTKLFVTNRRGGSISVIDVATRAVVATWQVGGTPDMIAVSPDGSRLWVSNRFSGTVSVVDAENGEVIATIKTGANPHGLSYWPEPGRFSLGHNGNMR